MNFPHLFSPGKIGDCTLKNRIIMPLFPTKYATKSKVNPKMLAFYKARAKGQVGLIVLDCPCLDYPKAYKGGHQLRFDKEEYEQGIRDLLNVIHLEGTKAFMQLNYVKEKNCSMGTPGAKKKKDKWVVPLVDLMTSKEAQQIINVMAQGAKKAKELGYDGVEIQASYGGLIAQLLSPLLNKRSDSLGGSLENRVSFLVQLIERVKKEAGKVFPVMVKLVCDEFVQGGLTIDEGVRIAGFVEKAGADAIVANAGNKSTKHVTIPCHETSPGPLVEQSRQVKSKVGIPVVTIGKIGEPKMAEEIISNGKADFIAMARALVADPDLPVKASTGKMDDIRRCVYCLEDCADKGVPGIGRCCAVNPFAGLEHVMEVKPARVKKKILVAGGGPAGIQAALMADLMGHDVTLWEKEDRLGGLARLMHIAPYKKEMEHVLDYLNHSLKKSRVNVRLGQKADIKSMSAFKPDVVIIAIGSLSILPDLPGMDSSNAIAARYLYKGIEVSGSRIVIVGGGDIGCETAEWIAGKGRQITIVELLPQILKNMKKIPRKRMMARLSQKGINILTETQMKSMDNEQVLLVGKGNKEFMVEADAVVLALPSSPDDSFIKEVKGKFKKVLTVGDAETPGNLGSALRSAAQAALTL